MRFRNTGWAALAGLWVAGFVAAPVVAEDRFDLWVSTALGYDSNPLQLQADGPGAAYAELGLGLGYTLDLGNRFSWFVDLDAARREHESRAEDADATDGLIETGVAFHPIADDRGRAGGLIGLTAEAHDSTFTDRATGLPYQIVADGSTIPVTVAEIGDRFDARAYGMFLRLFWRPKKIVRFGLELRSSRNDYVEDYDGLNGVHPLDYDALSVEPEIQIQIAPRAAVTLDATFADIDYRAQPALDASGGEVAGSTRSYVYGDVGLRLRVAPVGRLRVELGVRDADRSDLFAGYYDFAARVGYASLDTPIGQRHRLQLYHSRQDVDYTSAAVVGSLSGELRGSEVERSVARYDIRLPRGLVLFAEGGVQSTDNNDPLYAYDRSWISSGLRYRR